MEDLFKTYLIAFENREDFEKATHMDHLAHDIGWSDMVLVYSNIYFRNRFAGYLSKVEGIKVSIR